MICGKTDVNEAQGTIVDLDGDYALVRLDEGGCGRCHEAGGCGGQRLEKMFCQTPPIYRVRNPGGARIGERVTVAIEAGVTGLWHKYVGLDGAVVGLDRFGESAPAKVLFDTFGFTVAHVTDTLKSVL